MPDKRIKPCPLCGSPLKLRRRQRTVIRGAQVRITYCYCRVCDLRGPRVKYSDFDTPEQAEEFAIKTMNKRRGVSSE